MSWSQNLDKQSSYKMREQAKKWKREKFVKINSPLVSDQGN